MGHERPLALGASFPADLRYLKLCGKMARLAASPMRADEEAIDQLELCVTEAVTNAIKYSAPSGDHVVTLGFEIEPGRMTVRVTDQGKGFDMAKVPDPDFDEHPSGGYGLFIIKEMMDEVVYERRDGGNVLTMMKKL